MPLTTLDHTLFHFINHSCANPVMDVLCPIARDKNTWIPFYIMGSLLVLYKYRLQGLLILFFAGLSVLISDQSSNCIKHFVHRLRPCAVDQTVRLLVAHCSDTYSFTSNHAANHFALAIYLSLAFRQYTWLAVVLIMWAAFICLSQVYVGLHYPADITAGTLLGSIAGILCYTLFKKSRRTGTFESVTSFK